ncbi:MAG: hypothetical protein Q7S40_13540 [Opitutaceae bacterium]|nr:hypothetical protein [Opitutaceae bacterium]
MLTAAYRFLGYYGALGPFKPGFAAIAQHAAVPVQVLRITTTPRFFTKETRYWRVPPLPARVVVEAGPCFDPAAARSLDVFVTEVESWFADCRAAHARTAVEAWPATASSPTLTAT